MPECFRDMQIWIDNQEIDYVRNMKDTFYLPNSPVNLIGVVKFRKQSELTDEKFSKGTNIQTFTNHSIFAQDRYRHSQTIVHPPHSTPTMLMNNGFSKLEASCAVFEYVCNEQLHKAFMSNDLTSTFDFMKEMKSIIKEKDLSDDMKCYCSYHIYSIISSQQIFMFQLRKEKYYEDS